MYLGKEMRDLAKQLLIVCFQGICIPPKLGKVSSPARASADSNSPSSSDSLPPNGPPHPPTPAHAHAPVRIPAGYQPPHIACARSLSRTARAPPACVLTQSATHSQDCRSAIPRAWNPARSHSHVPARIGPNVPFPVYQPPIRVQARERWPSHPRRPGG